VALTADIGDAKREENFWDEMNRREEWDRDWEWRYKPFRDDPRHEQERQTLLDEKDREGRSRLAWDEQHQHTCQSLRD
jgi:YD repeat-containing protein